ncbi:MAG: hypothetical protein JO022_05135, partial [Acidobacteriaceae bacterium]|nr:hypothetical protein [Acidobacteriaceae bacterium]
MAGKRDKSAKTSTAPAWRYLGSLALFTTVLIGLIFGVQQVEQFLIRDARFMLTPPLEYGEESPNLHIRGIQYAS